MKIPGRDAKHFCSAPPGDLIGVLLHGEDPGLVSERRREIVNAILGAEGKDLQLVRLDAAEARRDPAAIEAALKTRGFFAARHVVLIEGGTDALTKRLDSALDRVTAEDGFLLVTGDVLPVRSTLRNLFEKTGNLASVGLYPGATSEHEIDAILRVQGMTCGLTSDATDALRSLAGEMDHGSFRRFLELLALSGLDRVDPLDSDAISALAPAGLETDIDAFIAAVAGGDASALGSLLRRLQASGATPVSVLIPLQRHFRMLLRVASSEGGLARIRPPVWGPRRNQVVAQLRQWGGARLEQANRLLFETDRRLRSSERAPDFALLERAALRLAIMAKR